VTDINEPGVPRMFTAILRDATQRLADEAALRHLGSTDALTGVANRAAVLECVTVALRRLDQQAGVVAVLFLDIDHFKTINDTLGHAVGDQVLRSVVTRLGPNLRPSDTLGRLGGDEFVIVCSEDAERAGVTERIVRRVQRALAPPHLVDGHEIVVTASIGVVEVTDSVLTADEVLHRADVAMYRAKAEGRNGHRWYSADLEVAAPSGSSDGAATHQA
jgi:diguanylate cyclase (GGDEF)-like protein